MPATYEPIASTTLSSLSNSITFTSFGTGYTDLKIILIGTTETAEYAKIQFNNDTGTKYSVYSLVGQSATAYTYSTSNETSIYCNGYPSTSTTIPFMFEIDIFNYSGSTFKSTLSRASVDKGSTGGTERIVGSWRDTAAITSIKLFLGSAANFQIGTNATLYGILKA